MMDIYGFLLVQVYLTCWDDYKWLQVFNVCTLLSDRSNYLVIPKILNIFESFKM